MLKKMVIPGERITEEEGSEDTDDTDTASIGALLRLKQLSRKEYADITARLAASF